jgi:DNA-binding CsgD family transcriptional regulator
MLEPLTIPQRIVLKQVIFGTQSVLELREEIGLPVNEVRRHVAEICRKLGVSTLREAVHVAVRGDDAPIDFTPDFGYDRKAARQRAQERQRKKETICRFVDDYHKKHGVYALFEDVQAHFGMTADETREYLNALDKTYYIEIIIKNRQWELRPLARP